MTRRPGSPGRSLWFLGLVTCLVLADATMIGLLLRRRHVADPAGGLGVLGPGGLAPALDRLQAAAAGDTLVLREGHQLAHALGRQAVGANGGDASVIGQCRPDFGSGCYHGVVEAFVQTRGRVDMAELERMCVVTGSDARPGPVSECMHGLGHGVLAATGFDLPATLRLCDSLRLHFRDPCYSGAFMETINSAMSVGLRRLAAHGQGHAGMASGHPAPVDSADPYSPCDRFDDPYGSACWLLQGFLILRRADYDAGEAFWTCDSAPAGRVAGCYESVGHQLTGLFQRDDQWIIAQCRRGRPELAPACAGGAAHALAQVDWSGGRAARFCAVAPPEWKEACYRTAAKVLATLTPQDQRVALCRAIEPAYTRACRLALGQTIFADTVRHPSVGEP